MGEIIGLIAVTFIFGGGTLFLLSISPVGRAIAARINGRVGAALSEEEIDDLRALRQELGDLHVLRGEMTELAERVDFAERLLAQHRESGRLGPPAAP